MILQKKTLEKLRKLINEETEYRSGPALVQFFNDLGSNDSYYNGFPSRWFYTDQKLENINGTPELDKCIKKVFDPINFIGNIHNLDRLIGEFNQYLTFDKWLVIRNNEEITFKRSEKVNLQTSEQALSEEEFLNMDFEDIKIEKLGLGDNITHVIEQRLTEIKKCLQTGSSLSVIFLSGSILEGVLLGTASKFPKEFNQSRLSPKDQENKVKPFHEWTLCNFIDVSYDTGFLNYDVKIFSDHLRNFRNYIHPYQQVISNFDPDIHTARISWQVLKAAFHQIIKNIQNKYTT